ncbi:UNVERIFIED_CONTAM: UDP-4-amino-4,6-dideoxy-N-acetyl-beta-L-altrosamine N-acetyltransferase [Pseudomonas sp. JL1]|jgi:UDP-4-amino-4,6-dideoxy-N-acetyl-beta-L-altrosamine N-acetyltransferase
MDNSQPMQLSIRKMTVDDLDVVLAWRNHAEIRRYMYTQHEITIEEHRGWFERASQDARKHLLVFEVGGKPQGFVNISEQTSYGVADWGFYIAPDAAKGTGRQLGQTALEYAFRALNLHKVCGQALAFNERSIQFHRTLGFQQEGTLRDQHYDGENYHAVICFGLLSNEWQPEDRSQ